MKLLILIMGNIFASFNIVKPNHSQLKIDNSDLNPEVTYENFYYDNSSVPEGVQEPFLSNSYQSNIPLFRTPSKSTSFDYKDLIGIDIEDLLKNEGITSINGKAIKFGNRGLRDRNANYGSKNSNHYKLDPYTGFASARDISIENGTIQDYHTFRQTLLNNPKVVAYMKAKNWGIINEVTQEILNESKGTGLHFHFGPDKWAVNTWNHWNIDPNIPITLNLKNRNIEKRDGTYVKPSLVLSIPKQKKETKQIDFSGIKTTNNRSYDKDKIAYINERLSSISPMQKASIIANIIEESGGNPFASDGTFSGLIGWRGDRYSIKHKDNEQLELDSQIQHILDTLNNLDDKLTWTHGGKDSGYNSLKDAHNDFMNGTTLQQVNKAFTLGYVRPTGKNQSALNRLRVANQIYNLIKNE